ncbi:hypothetical protein BT69DRAFT_1335645 [Atractiella rhizophila]|nr:hypothetical protein BT69DRAFT_1335645 [Atractiella rhizophila]
MPRVKFPRPHPASFKQHSSNNTHSRILHLRRHENTILSSWQGGSKPRKIAPSPPPELKLASEPFARFTSQRRLEESPRLEKAREALVEKWSKNGGLFLNPSHQPKGGVQWGYSVGRIENSGMLPVYSDRRRIDNKKFTLIRKIQGSPFKMLYDLRASFPDWTVRLKEPSMIIKIEGKRVDEVKKWLEEKGF